MVAGDEHDGRVGQRLAQPLELLEGENDRGVGGADRVEQVADDDDGVGTRRDHPIYRLPKGVGDIRLALIDAGGGLTMILPKPQVGIGEVGQSHMLNVM